MNTEIERAAETMWAAIDDKGINGRLTRKDCAYLAEALAAAGLIATQIEWGVSIDGGAPEWAESEGEARRAAADDKLWRSTWPRKLHTRYTLETPWKDAP